MPDYCRIYRPGGTFFFTVVTNNRIPIFADSGNIDRLRESIRQVKQQWPFTIDAAIILPDHLHFIWTLPPEDMDYSRRIGRMKTLFTQSLGTEGIAHQPSISSSRIKHREAAIWQRRFWEHAIRDERDLENHLNYIYYNPVKHNLARCPHEWQYSSFAHSVATGLYDQDWCCACHNTPMALPFPEELSRSVGE